MAEQSDFHDVTANMIKEFKKKYKMK